MQLRFNEQNLMALADSYNYRVADDSILDLTDNIQSKGYIEKNELFKIAHWKAPRSANHVYKNDEEFIKEITGFSFTTTSERARIEALTNLDGVSWPTASVILHLFNNDPYPILDFRALWSVSLDVPSQYSYKFWWPYVEFCRDIAVRNNVDMRTLDKSLWQYSKENQK